MLRDTVLTTIAALGLLAGPVLAADSPRVKATDSGVNTATGNAAGQGITGTTPLGKTGNGVTPQEVTDTDQGVSTLAKPFGPKKSKKHRPYYGVKNRY